jgi:hypothetical protein
MTNMIRKTLVAIKGGPGGAGIFVFGKKKTIGGGRIYIDRKGGVPEPLSTDRLNVLGSSVAAITLDGSDDGVTVVSNNSAATVVVTLPKASTVGAGFTARVLAGVLPGAGAGLTVTPNAADKFQGNGFSAKTAGQTLVNSAASDVVGDMVEVVSDGNVTWFVTNKIGTWA